MSSFSLKGSPELHLARESMAALGFILFVFTSACLALQIYCQVSDTADLSTVWASRVPDHILAGYKQAVDPCLVRVLDIDPDRANFFGAGFYCVFPCNTFIFGVYAFTYSFSNPQLYEEYSVLVVWSANRGRQVRQNATLSLTGTGDLVLQDADGSIVWSSNTSGRSVVGMNMTESGNLVLFDHDNVTVWQSFDYPADALLPGQRLVAGKSLTPSMSFDNLTISSQFNFTVRPDGVYAFAGYQEPQLYHRDTNPSSASGRKRQTYVVLKNGSLNLGVSAPKDKVEYVMYSLQISRSLQCIRFESDGHLRLYEWTNDKWSVVQDILDPDQCNYPTVCGNYGICSGGQCSCPVPRSTNVTYFRQIDDQRPNLGCILDTPISCQSMEDHQLIEVHNVSYFNYIDQNAEVLTDEESCKKACLGNCSCHAALFQYDKDGLNGSCLLVSEVLSLVGSSPGIAFLKVQITKPPQWVKNRRVLLLPYTLGGGTAALILFVIVFAVIRWRRNEEEADEDEFGELPGMPKRFSFQLLKVATKEFSSKIGEGGFSSVFSGELDDLIVAVKNLHRAAQGTKEFLAEVQIIGGLHHINLVRLIGFCSEKAHRLLVYEYMPRGSLDKWIYYGDNKAPLDWHTRRKIISNIAKGLSYLHEECRQRIAHLDIKPQNILLDDNFDAKVADFGLSKLIDRDQSHVVTRMRGTPGYMAPEWLTSQITEKVDVYSFGVLVMEIIYGRKNLDYSQPAGSIQLISLLQEKAKNGKLEDLIDRNSEDMHTHKDEVIGMMNLAIWCLQSDSSRRPAMSLVVKVMEGERQVESNLEYNFFDLSALNAVPVGEPNLSTVPIASALSSPR
ncbi:unnamed protein product [Urochloa decumbens]|uniref:Receptor-like serine/threonine-protein kinase n=1 Tax=Urochloa decumbens TaxID=240449 RepID=A0ABC8ZG39_9POAL